MPTTLVRFFASLLIILTFLPLRAQDAQVFENGIFQDNIKTVLFHASRDQLADPIIRLNSSDRLILRFDDLDADVKRYFYTVVHCDADWRPSALEKHEYIDGFDMEEIYDLEFSRGTMIPYTHYHLRIPNRNFNFSKSGNYVLQVFDPELRDPLILSRRFVVYEPKLSVAGEIVTPTNVAQSRTHQEVTFFVSQKKYLLTNPTEDLRACILQNGWWDNAMCNISPRYVSGDILNFDYRGRLVFPGLRNFRPMDLRTTRFRSERVHSIEHYQDGTEIIMRTDDKRTHRSHSLIHDFNGKFIIENREFPNPHITSDYVYPFLTLRSPTPIYDRDVFVVGGFSDMRPREENRMSFDDAQGLYYKELFIKQGYYDYLYGVGKQGSSHLDFEETEGSLFETNNEYHILLYFRSFGGRYDQVIGYGRVTQK